MTPVFIAHPRTGQLTSRCADCEHVAHAEPCVCGCDTVSASVTLTDWKRNSVGVYRRGHAISVCVWDVRRPEGFGWRILVNARHVASGPECGIEGQDAADDWLTDKTADCGLKTRFMRQRRVEVANGPG